MEWRKALYDLEENPPAQCWSAIKVSIDQDIPQIRKKLNALSEIPPAQSEQKIFNRLEKRKKAKIIEFSRQKAVAAASIALLITLSLFYFLSSPSNQPKIGASMLQSKKKVLDKKINPVLDTVLHDVQIKASPKLYHFLKKYSKQEDSSHSDWQKK